MEFNPTVPNHTEFVQPRDFSLHQGNSLLSLTNLADRKGYELVAVTVTNGIFVCRELFPKAGLTYNSLDTLRPSRDLQTTLFQLYDGTLVLDGFTNLFWHDMMPIPPERIQVSPGRCAGSPAARRGFRSVQRSWLNVERWRLMVRRWIAVRLR